MDPWRSLCWRDFHCTSVTVYQLKCILKWNRSTVFHLDDVSQPQTCLTKNSFLSWTYCKVVGENRHYFQHFLFGLNAIPSTKQHSNLFTVWFWQAYCFFFSFKYSKFTGFGKLHFGVVFILGCSSEFKYYLIRTWVMPLTIVCLRLVKYSMCAPSIL